MESSLFFFSSRRRHTRSLCDWSSDVCSSDLFVSPNTGYFLIRAHKAGFGNAKSNPRYITFLRDLREIGEGVIVGQGNWQQIGRASCRERVEISEVDVELKKKKDTVQDA